MIISAGQIIASSAARPLPAFRNAGRYTRLGGAVLVAQAAQREVGPDALDQPAQLQQRALVLRLRPLPRRAQPRPTGADNPASSPRASRATRSDRRPAAASTCAGFRARSGWCRPWINSQSMCSEIRESSPSGKAPHCASLHAGYWKRLRTCPAPHGRPFPLGARPCV